MSDELNKITGESPFDQIKHVTSKGGEYWRARELQEALCYSKWDKFEDVIGKAEAACNGSGVSSHDQFLQTGKMVEVGSGALRETKDYFLTRYACYLIAMNGDSAKREIAEAQTYFARQTRKQELQDRLTDEQKRIHLRNRVKDGNTILKEAAHECGVEDFARFQNAGYRGLYGGFGASDLKRKKGIPDKHDLLDCINREELAANEFRITQTEKRLRGEDVSGEDHATGIHNEIGKKVRKAIQEIGGTMPENLPAEANISQIMKKPENKALVKSLKEARVVSNRLERPPIISQPENIKWNADARVVLCGVSNGAITEDGTGFQNFPSLESARELFPDLDTHRNSSRFTWATGEPTKSVMRFETWKAYEIYSQ